MENQQEINENRAILSKCTTANLPFVGFLFLGAALIGATVISLFIR